MKTTTMILAAALCSVVLCFGTVKAQLNQEPAAPRFGRDGAVEVKGALIFDRIIYLPVMLNGAGPFSFILDTGAGSVSAVDQSIADSLGLRQAPLQEGGGAGEETVQINAIDSAAISMPGLSFDARTIISIPLHRGDSQWGRRRDGLVGGDLLSTLATRIDYDSKRVDFHEASSYEYTGTGERIPVQILGGFIFLEAEVSLFGKEEPIDAVFMLDTGVRMTTFNSPYSMRHSLAAQSPRTTSGVVGFGIGGVSRGVIGRVRGIRIGSYTLENPVVDFSTDEQGALADTSFSGIVGADILSRFHLVLDYVRSSIILEKNRSFGAPFEFDMCGIRFVMEGEHFDVFKVFSVFGGSPAAEAGIEQGDLVTTIDGRRAGEFTRETLREYLQRDGERVRLTIERGAERKDVTIRLRRLV
jgi:hypothetical protein